MGVWTKTGVEIIANDHASSYVASADSQRLNGDAAKNQTALNAENTVFDAKRLIHCKFADPIVQSLTDVHRSWCGARRC